jgi:hypothetical protein
VKQDVLVMLLTDEKKMSLSSVSVEHFSKGPDTCFSIASLRSIEVQCKKLKASLSS